MATVPQDTPILVLDDSPAIRARVEAYLRQLGYREVRTASSIETGLEAFREQGSEVVFLDLIVGDQTGAKFAAQALEEKPFTYVILMTALSRSHEQVVATIAEGARDLLSKPIQLADLRAVLDRIGASMEEDRATRRADASYA